jgi:hypothetical protein
MKTQMQTWLRRIRWFVKFVYGPSPIGRPSTKPPPTGLAFDLAVVTLFFVFGIGLLFV